MHILAFMAAALMAIGPVPDHMLIERGDPEAQHPLLGEEIPEYYFTALVDDPAADGAAPVRVASYRTDLLIGGEALSAPLLIDGAAVETGPPASNFLISALEAATPPPRTPAPRGPVAGPAPPRASSGWVMQDCPGGVCPLPAARPGFRGQSLPPAPATARVGSICPAGVCPPGACQAGRCLPGCPCPHNQRARGQQAQGPIAWGDCANGSCGPVTAYAPPRTVFYETAPTYYQAGGVPYTSGYGVQGGYRGGYASGGAFRGPVRGFFAERRPVRRLLSLPSRLFGRLRGGGCFGCR